MLFSFYLLKTQIIHPGPFQNILPWIFPTEAWFSGDLFLPFREGLEKLNKSMEFSTDRKYEI